MHRYEELKCIGRGSYGSAHLVTERATGSRFVIKKIPMELLSESEKQQSFREVELLAKLQHPNVVEYKESFVDSNVIHIVMAYCDGGDLAGRIKERVASGLGYFDTRQILDWFVQMAMAIKYLHAQRVLHRDLKTSNIFLTTTNVIKLGDFGIAKTLDSTLDQAKTVVGTPYYMSPEVCESKPYSYASDVWSLGCVLYEMVALRHAFDAPNILTLILKIVQSEFAAIPPQFDAALSDILKRLLDKRPEHRPTMDQIFLMPYIRHHMQALMASGGSLQMHVVARRPPHGTPKRRTAPSSTRTNGSNTTTTSTSRRSSQDSASRPPRRAPRWASIAPTERDSSSHDAAVVSSDLELLDASVSMDESATDVRLPERSRTPEPLPAWSSTAAEIVDDVVVVDDDALLGPSEALLMNPNFQRVYAEECDDSLTVKYAAPAKSKPPAAMALSESGLLLRQLELEDASSSSDDADMEDSEGAYDGEENFYSEHSSYSDDSDFAAGEDAAEYSDDFEEGEGEVIEYAHDEFAPEEEDEDREEEEQRRRAGGELRSPKRLASSPAARHAPREVQWVMRNVAQSLLESCENLSVA